MMNGEGAGTIGFESLAEAYMACRRHKRGAPNALAFERDWERELWRLCEELNARSYRIGPASAFIVERPVKREVFAAPFRDRVVHHWLMRRLQPLLEAEFDPDCYSCREGKGTLFGIRRVRGFIAECSEGYTRECWVLKCDLRGFFMSIGRMPLADRLSELIGRKYDGGDKDTVLWLTRLIALHAPERDCVLRSDPRQWRGLSHDKSLFAMNGLPMPCQRRWAETRGDRERQSLQTELFGWGLPIGNLTSQWFGNFCLTPFDRYVRERIGDGFYGRYVDDMVIVHRDRAFLRALVPAMERYLDKELGLTLHPRKRTLQSGSKRLKFLGTVLLPGGGMHVGTRTKTNMYRTVRRWNRTAERQGKLTDGQLKRLRTSINSYWGLMSHMDSYRLRRSCAAALDGTIRQVASFPRYRKMRLCGQEGRKALREWIARTLEWQLNEEERK